MFRELKNGIKPQIRLIVSNQGDHHSLEYTIKLQLKVSDPPHMVRCGTGRKDQKHAECRFRSSFVFQISICVITVSDDAFQNTSETEGNTIVFTQQLESAKDAIQLSYFATKIKSTLITMHLVLWCNILVRGSELTHSCSARSLDLEIVITSIYFF